MDAITAKPIFVAIRITFPLGIETLTKEWVFLLLGPYRNRQESFLHP